MEHHESKACGAFSIISFLCYENDDFMYYTKAIILWMRGVWYE